MVSLRCSLTVAVLLLGPSAATGQVHVDASAPPGGDGSSWARAFSDLSAALLVAVPEQEVWVAAGVYKPSPSDRTVSFDIPYRVDMYGGFAGTETSLDQRAGLFEQTVLSGDLAGDDGPDFTGRVDNSMRVVRIGYESIHVAIFDGFTIRGGYALGAKPEDSVGGGMECRVNFRDIRNCRFVDNFAGFGGGLALGAPSTPTLTDCEFIGNRALFGGGAAIATQERIVFRGCAFEDNYSDSGTAAVVADLATFVDCRFERNRAASGGAGAFQGDGGVFVRSAFRDNEGRVSGAITGAGLTVAACTFAGNVASGPGFPEPSAGAVVGSGLVAHDSLFVGNSAPSAPSNAGAIVSAGVELLLSTVAYNSTGDAGTGGLVAPGGRVQNSILWGNRGGSAGGQNDQVAGVGVALYFSCVEGLDPERAGRGNTGSDPAFRDPAGPDGELATADDDFGLCVHSPCVDAGDSGAIPGDRGDVDADGNRDEPLQVDLAGAPRRFDLPRVPDAGAGAGPPVDMGAFEATVDPAFCPATANSTGGVARIAILGCTGTSLAADDLRLMASPVPDTSGVFVYGPSQGQRPFADGVRCVAGTLRRLPVATASGGVLATAVAASSLGQVTPGSVWYFQAWFRDEAAGGLGSNLSDALPVHFAP